MNFGIIFGSNVSYADKPALLVLFLGPWTVAVVLEDSNDPT